MDALKRVTIYTDGGAAPNPGPGGWAALLIAQGAEKELSGADPQTTNNRMELTAAVEALRALKEKCVVELYTDSQYLQRGITEWLPAWRARGWSRGRQEIANLDLWQALDAETRRHQITWRWVKGHAGDRHNERVDRLATEARERIAPPPQRPDDADTVAQVAIRVSSLPGGAGGWAARVALPGESESQTLTGRARATSNRLELDAAIAALRTLPEEVPARVFCPSDYLHQGITRWIKGWHARNWTTKEGEPVKNADLWRALEAEAGKRQVSWSPARECPPDLADELDKLAAQTARGEA